MEFDPAQISQGAMTLLVIALKKDQHKKLPWNATLEETLKCLGDLPSKCQVGPGAVERLFQHQSTPRSVFGLSAELIDSIEERIGQIPEASQTWSNRSEFDHPAFVALAQTLAKAAGVERGQGPDIVTALERIARCEPLQLQERLVINYIGTILQDYFEACEVRRSLPHLPEGVEEKLRSNDAAKLASGIFESVSSSARGADLDRLRRSIGQRMAAVFIAQSKSA